MTTSIIDINGVDVRSAECFMPDCYFPITDMTKRCPPDEVVNNFPILLGHWANNTKAPALLSSDLEIDMSGVQDECCDTGKVRRKTTMGEVYAPNMKEVALGTDDIKICDLLDPFCEARRIKPDGLCIFERDGSIAVGEPYALDFYRMAISDVSEAMMRLLTRSALVGDSANDFQVDGLYTQIDNGWTAVTGPGCGPIPDELNMGTTINWTDMTEDCGLSQEGRCAGPDSRTKGGVITIWGEECEVPAGLTFAQFLEEIWIDKVGATWTDARGGVDAWEMHIPHGKSICLLNNAECMGVCNSCGSGNCDSGYTINREYDAIMASIAEKRRSKILQLKPSNRLIPLMETRFIPDNTIRLGPRSIGGRPTYGMFFRNIADVINGLPVTYGTSFGTQEYENFLAPEVRNMLRKSFESQAFYSGVTRTSLRCFKAEMMAQFGVLACWRHAWLKVEGICCCGCVNCDESISTVSIDGQVVPGA